MGKELSGEGAPWGGSSVGRELGGEGALWGGCSVVEGARWGGSSVGMELGEEGAPWGGCSMGRMLRGVREKGPRVPAEGPHQCWEPG